MGDRPGWSILKVFLRQAGGWAQELHLVRKKQIPISSLLPSTLCLETPRECTLIAKDKCFRLHSPLVLTGYFWTCYQIFTEKLIKEVLFSISRLENWTSEAKGLGTAMKWLSWDLENPNQALSLKCIAPQSQGQICAPIQTRLVIHSPV